MYYLCHRKRNKQSNMTKNRQTTKIKGVCILNNAPKPFLERNDTTETYYNEVRKYKLISNEETFALLEEYQTAASSRKEEIRDILFKHNCRLVISVARAYCSSNDNLNDLIQEGNIGLLNAIEQFDFSKNSTFQKVALFYIRREINLFKMNASHIVQQTNRSKTNSVINGLVNSFIQQQERMPTPEELLDAYNNRYPNCRTLNSAQDIINVNYVYIDSLEGAGHEEELVDGQNYLDYCSTSATINSCIGNEQKEYQHYKLSQLLTVLTPKEKQAILLYYGLTTGFDESLHMIGTKMNCSSERARQLCASALKKMQKQANYLKMMNKQ